jgi:hypothetical protein
MMVASLFGACSRANKSSGAGPPGGEANTAATSNVPFAPGADLAFFYTAGVQGAAAPPAAPPNAPGGLARRATLVDQARLDAKAVVEVDAGDFLPAADDPAFAPPAAFERRARLILDAYQRMDVDAVTLGERELGVDSATLRKWLTDTKLPVVLANVSGSDGKPLFAATRVFQAAGHTIGVFGVVELGPDAAALAQRMKFTVGDPVAAAQAAVRDLRAAGVELVVGLVHATGGADRARAIAAAAPGIDLLVPAHAEPTVAGGAVAHDPRPPLVLVAGAGGTRIGRIDLRPAPSEPLHFRFDDRLQILFPTVRNQFAVQLLITAETTPVLGLTIPTPDKKHPDAKPQREVFEVWSYASTRACAMCHPAQAQQWNLTDHAHAMATLQKKGRERDPACVGCHSFAFMQPGGTANMNTLAYNFGDVGCEACHGPSAAHVRSMKKKEGTSVHVDPLVCLGCHTPDQSQGPFDFAVALKDVLGPGHGSPSQPGGAIGK